ncbi:MAG: FAD/NAD(P)-binding protein [Gaiella sp.]
MAASAPSSRLVAPRGALTPVPYRVVERAQETADTWTLELEPLRDRVVPRPGQFAMLYAFGVGEVPISTSGDPARDGPLTHTIRAVGAVTERLCAAEPGGVIGVRGPFGTAWPIDEALGGDALIVAGGIGLAPLRPAVLELLAQRDAFDAVTVLVGARSPADLLYRSELETWRSRLDLDVEVTVDAAPSDWRGRVGLVTTLLPRVDIDPERTVAFVCGPELMMTFVARALRKRGLPSERIWVSLERNMRCGLGHCGHCQLGPFLICRDGPVFRLDVVERFTEVREL